MEALSPGPQRHLLAACGLTLGAKPEQLENSSTKGQHLDALLFGVILNRQGLCPLKTKQRLPVMQ